MMSDSEPTLDILNVLKSDLIWGKTVLIIKPTTVFHQSDGLYFVSVVKPTSHETHLGKQQQLAHARIAKKKRLIQSKEAPEAPTGRTSVVQQDGEVRLYLSWRSGRFNLGTIQGH